MENATANVHVEEGKFIDETSYSRRPKKWKELNLQYLKIDHYDPKTKQIREVKKSPKLEYVHIAQVKYYIYALEKRGVNHVTGIIEYPRQRKTRKVDLTNEDRDNIRRWISEIQHITHLSVCPDAIEEPYCKSCSFRDFCYV